MKKRRGLGIEDKMHKSFATIVRSYEAFNQLNCTFWSYYPAGENRTVTTGSLLKAKGSKCGIPDFFFIQEHENFYNLTWIEFKTPTGKQSESQKEFEEIFKKDYFIARSVEEGVKILEERGIVNNL
jgi:hypothetical protein